MENFLFETWKLIHDESFFSRVDHEEALWGWNEGYTSKHEKIAEPLSHEQRLYFN